MANKVKHGKRYFKQMALEVAVRNPERYEDILKTFAKYEGIILNDEGILKVYSQLYLDNVVTTDKLANIVLTEDYLYKWIKDNCKHNNEWGYPTGYQAAFTRYLKTLSEFGFIYAQYNQKLRLSPISKALVNGKITLSEAFAVQSMRFWRKSQYRRVLNDFNFFEFIMDALIKLKNKGHKLSINQFNVGLFSDDGDVDDFLNLIKNNKIGNDTDKAYCLVKSKYDDIDTLHAKVSSQNTAFRDYGNTVFRVLQLTGFISVDYKGILMLSPNENRMDFYKALKAEKFSITESAKEDEEEYFELLGSFDCRLESIVVKYREKEDHSTAEYNKKLSQIISSYKLTPEVIEQHLIRVSSGNNKGKDLFWFIQNPVKFEFLLTLYVYTYFGDSMVYKPNYICDEVGIPYSHAPGNIGDIEIYCDEKYWLIEATLIRSKIQQVNNETVNLFRHIDKTRVGDKYLTLVAPYIHDDTKLIFNVASVITMIQTKMLTLSSVTQTTDEFVDALKTQNYFSEVRNNSCDFIKYLKKQINSIIALQ